MSLDNVKTKYGTISGVRKSGYSVYKGIPYAKPPVGDLRWKRPQEPDCWEGIYKAIAFPNMCMQEWDGDAESPYTKEFHSDPEFETESSEDCLYLNIWTPAVSENEKLPVAFWIHGGAFLGGSGNEITFDGESYCQRGIVLVTINYRCNVYGFLAHPWLAAENEQGIAGNYGILDQVQALRWIYENIGNFGGDPENITVFGQSAGSMSAQTLLSSELTGNIIKKAIFQSGGGYNSGLSRDMDMYDAMEIGKRFVQISGVSSLKELRALSSRQVNKAFHQLMDEYMSKEGLIMIPVIDGYVLKGGYEQLVDEGKVKDIPYLLGSNKQDMLTTPESIADAGKSSLYAGCVKWSHKMEELRRKPSYVYYFTRQLPGDSAGAFHSAELWYMFGTLSRCWRPMESRDYRLSEEMLDYWSNFMKFGNPNGEGEGNWEPCSKENKFVKLFE